MTPQGLLVIVRTIARIQLEKELQGGQGKLDLVCMVLIYQGKPSMWAPFDFTVRWLQFTNDEFHKRCFLQ